MKQKFFIINNKKVPFIHGGSVDSLGSTLSATFTGSFSFNPNTSKSTDILFMQLALGEGPVYRINPNGPQDIEIDDKYIDDLVDFNSNNTKTDVFVAKYATGTLQQKPMSSFFNESVNSIRFSSPVQLKSGLSSSVDTPAPLKTSIEFFPTSASEDLLPIDSIRFKFNVRDLRVEQNSGAEPGVMSLLAIIHPRNETVSITNYIAANGTIINSIVQGSMAVEIEVKIPDELKKSEGYRVSMLKISEDVGEEGYISEVEAIGFDEIRKEQYAYPGTALAGYAIKSTDFRTNELPTYTSLNKRINC
jgi:predicted phage tail protein